MSRPKSERTVAQPSTSTVPATAGERTTFTRRRDERPGSVGRILLVEDSRTQAHQLRCQLEAEGYTVDVATSGEQGFDLFRARPFDLVISDIVMPGLGGYDLCRKIKNEPLRNQVPVILLSSLTEPLEIIRALECGADNFLNKPYQRDYLLGRIKAVLANSALLRGNTTTDGNEIVFQGKKLSVNSNTGQILNLLTATFEDIVRTNAELQTREAELAAANQVVDEYARRLEERVVTTEDRYRRIVQTMPDGLWVTDADRRITYVNERMAEMLGCAAEEVIGRLSSEFLTEVTDPLAPARPASDNAAPGSRREFMLRRKSGEDLWTVVASSSLVDGEGRPGGTLAIVSDVTERKSLEQRYHQSQKMEVVGQLAGGVAHDFNNMLAVILGFSEILETSAELDPKHRELLTEVRKAGERAASLTRQLLAFSRRQVLEPKTLNLNGVVTDIMQMLRRLIREDAELTTVLAPDLGMVRVDRGQIDQVLMNLVVNARDAMPQGGTIRIETANEVLVESQPAELPPGRYVRLSVVDNGVGMDAAVRARVFEPFFTTKEPGRGTGLGLATVYGIVQQSGGHISLASASGQGTTFHIYLPQVETSADESAASELQTEYSRGGERVLVVEDEPMVRSLACRVLRSHGYRVIEAIDGEEALQFCRTGAAEIDMVLTDLVMPRLGGVELANRLRDSQPGVKIIFMSGHCEDASVHLGLLHAQANFLQKPFTAAQLTRKVREILDR